MWPAFANSIETNAPCAEIVHDRFHISKHLNEAVDKVRRSEHKGLKQVGDERLTGSKQLWLLGPERGIVKCCVLRSVSSGGFLQDSVLEGTSFQDKCDLFVAA